MRSSELPLPARELWRTSTSHPTTGILHGMGNLEALPSAIEAEEGPRSSGAPWLALSLVVGGAISYVVALLLPYYVNNLDRLALNEIPWRGEFVGMWPHNTAYSFLFSFAGAYALFFAPFVAGGVALWMGGRVWLLGQSMTRLSYAVTIAAAAVAVGTVGWLFTLLASTLITRWLS